MGFFFKALLGFSFLIHLLCIAVVDSALIWHTGVKPVSQPVRSDSVIHFLKFISSWQTHRERRRHRQREKQAPCRDPRTPGSHPGLKAALNLWAIWAAPQPPFSRSWHAAAFVTILGHFTYFMFSSFCPWNSLDTYFLRTLTNTLPVLHSFLSFNSCCLNGLLVVEYKKLKV